MDECKNESVDGWMDQCKLEWQSARVIGYGDLKFTSDRSGTCNYEPDVFTLQMLRSVVDAVTESFCPILITKLQAVCG